MLLGLNKIIDRPGESVTFSTSVDLSDLRYGNSYPVSEPVRHYLIVMVNEHKALNVCVI